MALGTDSVTMAWWLWYLVIVHIRHRYFLYFSHQKPPWSVLNLGLLYIWLFLVNWSSFSVTTKYRVSSSHYIYHTLQLICWGPIGPQHKFGYTDVIQAWNLRTLSEMKRQQIAWQSHKISELRFWWFLQSTWKSPSGVNLTPLGGMRVKETKGPSLKWCKHCCAAM